MDHIDIVEQGLLLTHRSSSDFEKQGFLFPEEVQGPSENVTISSRNNRRKDMIARSIPVALVLFLLAVLVGMVLYIKDLKRSIYAPQTVQWKHCGNSSAEAQSRGCVLDLIDRAWIPPECHDDQLMDEFLHIQDWHWYADAEQRQEIPREVIEQGGGPSPVFVSNDYHWHHCAYMWRKMHRSIHHGKPMDNHLNSYGHTIHCSNDLLAHKPGVPLFFLIFASCPVPVSMA
jgi:hypothetical protein